MPRTLFALPLVAVSLMILLMPARAVAEPPDEGSGQMVVDVVADGLRKCRSEVDLKKRAKLLNLLVQQFSPDPRVAIALSEALHDKSDYEYSHDAAWLMNQFYIPADGTQISPLPSVESSAEVWWKRNEADIRRRARQLLQ